MIKPEKERVAYLVKTGLSGPVSAFHKNNFTLTEMLNLVQDDKLKQEYLDYHGLHKYLKHRIICSEYPIGIKVDIKVSKKGIPRMYYQEELNPKSIEYTTAINNIARDTQPIFPIVI